jgi:hypothetical protein
VHLSQPAAKQLQLAVVQPLQLLLLDALPAEPPLTLVPFKQPKPLLQQLPLHQQLLLLQHPLATRSQLLNVVCSVLVLPVTTNPIKKDRGATTPVFFCFSLRK